MARCAQKEGVRAWELHSALHSAGALKRVNPLMGMGSTHSATGRFSSSIGPFGQPFWPIPHILGPYFSSCALD